MKGAIKPFDRKTKRLEDQIEKNMKALWESAMIAQNELAKQQAQGVSHSAHRDIFIHISWVEQTTRRRSLINGYKPQNLILHMGVVLIISILERATGYTKLQTINDGKRARKMCPASLFCGFMDLRE